MPQVHLDDNAKIWWVVCDDYATGPFTRVNAVGRMQRIEKAGQCNGTHSIEARPRGSGRRW